MGMNSRLCAGLWLTGFSLISAPALATGQHAFVSSSASDFATAYQLNPGHTGSIDLSNGFTTPLKMAWSRSISTSFSGINYPVIADGLVFASAITNTVSTTYALNITTGKTVWSKAFQSSPPSLTYGNGMLFVQTFGGKLSAFASTTGKQKWSIQLPGGTEFPAYPTAADGQIFTSGEEEGGYLYSVNQADGTLQWSLFGLDDGESSPAYGDDGLYVGYPCQYFKFNPQNGKLDWHVNNHCNGGGSIVPVSSNGRVYFADNTTSNFILKSKNGNLIDTFAGATNPSIFTNARGKQYGVSLAANPQGTNLQLICWNVSTGSVAWTFQGDGQLQTVPIIVNGLVVEGSQTGMLYVIDSTKGHLKWSTNTHLILSNVVAGQGTLVVGGGDTIMAFVPQ
jgi:outer membrane protein assembly factor BamB